MSDRRPMSTAPRDGRTVIVGHDDMGEYVMRWDAEYRSNLLPGIVGFWVAATDGFTWCDVLEGGPSYWRHLNS